MRNLPESLTGLWNALTPKESLAMARLPVEGKMAEKLDAVGKPRNWDKAVSVAYLRLIGQSQADAAKAAGLGERTLRRYELSEWWPDACAEAVERWMQQLAIDCRSTILAAVKDGDVQTSVKMLERIDGRLAPPRQTHGIEHSGEVTTTVREMSDEELLERADQLANRVAVHTNGGRY